MTSPIVDVDTVDLDGTLALIDVRREEDYNQGHITGAVNLPLASLLSGDSPESTVKLFEELGIADDTKVVVYDDTFGALASRVVWTLQYIGHKNVALLEVTYSQWKDLGFKTSTEKPDIKPAKHSLHLKPSIMATAEYLENAKEKKNVVLIDNRERLNFLEQHIPGSINIPYRTLATDGKILRTKESMKNLLKNRGIPEDAEIITYCGSVGTLSGLAYYALKSIGVPNVKLYVNSFKEWKKLEKPIGKQENAAYWDLSAE
jgi:thiosulfate/3-mercaptopyruvate sulfurtransferase